MNTPKHPDEKEARRLTTRAIALGTIPLAGAVLFATGITLDNAGLIALGALVLIFATVPALVALSIDLEERNELLRKIDRRKWEEHQREQAHLNRIVDEMGWQQ